MKSITVVFSAALVLLTAAPVIGQSDALTAGGGFDPNPNNVPCLTEEDRRIYKQEVANGIAALEANGTLLPVTEGGSVLFRWPVEQAAGFNYNSTWSISNYLDHNNATGVLEDYNCGTRTYDTASGYDHQGLDIYTWPFWWKQQDDEQTNIVAAAAGQIISKRDGSFDRNCSFNSDPWNAVYVRHSDGSIAWYGHMKNGSLTTKPVGATVAEGEYLGVIGSSGNSTGPHLHFEVYDIAGNLIDPYTGPCNGLNPSSWWQSQKPYVNPQINALLTHTAIPDFGSCPTTEVTYESNLFEPSDAVWFGSYFKDQQPGTTSFHRLYDPSGDLYFSWTRNFVNFYYSSWWLRNVTVSAEEGTWTYEVDYNGETVEHEFVVQTLSTEENQLASVEMSPNPATNAVTLQSPKAIDMVAIYDLNGRLLQRQTVNANSVQLNISNLQSGIYFIKVSDQDGGLQSMRLIKR